MFVGTGIFLYEETLTVKTKHQFKGVFAAFLGVEKIWGRTYFGRFLRYTYVQPKT